MHQTRLTSIDALRGLASLAVVFWHWQHFFPTAAPTEQFPLFWLLWPLYQHGWWGVELFFSISGFIFFRLYAEPVAHGDVSSLSFAVLRFSRLYPLYFATMVSVAVTQVATRALTGSDFVFPSDSAAQFVQQLLLTTAWSGHSYTFNGPAWSVVVEVMLYGIFFGLAKLKLARLPVVAAICALAPFLLNPDAPLVRGVLSFFLGGVCAEVLRHAQSRSGLPYAAWIYLPATVLCMIVARLMWPHGTLAEFIAFTFAFPGLIIALVIYEDVLHPVTSRLEWLGNISYSSYLLHFPLQLALVTMAAWQGWQIDYRSPVTLLTFLIVLITLSLWSFAWFERPAMNALRRRLMARASCVPQSAAALAAPTRSR
ncbi:MAG: acyltransferase [Hyphomicrobiales bacterium]|jgi:peptidoglycan/LPS O-acetylase OafA/YrhL|nr:acyltransferase [Hyphomicrobiales bacterium]